MSGFLSFLLYARFLQTMFLEKRVLLKKKMFKKKRKCSTYPQLLKTEGESEAQRGEEMPESHMASKRQCAGRATAWPIACWSGLSGACPGQRRPGVGTCPQVWGQ